MYIDTMRCGHASQPAASTTISPHTPAYAPNMDLDANARWGDPTEQAPLRASQHAPKAIPHPAYNTPAQRYRIPQPAAQPNEEKTSTTLGFHQNEPNKPTNNAKPQYPSIIKNNLTNMKEPAKPQKPHWQNASNVGTMTRH